MAPSLKSEVGGAVRATPRNQDQPPATQRPNWAALMLPNRTERVKGKCAGGAWSKDSLIRHYRRKRETFFSRPQTPPRPRHRRSSDREPFGTDTPTRARATPDGRSCLRPVRIRPDNEMSASMEAGPARRSRLVAFHTDSPTRGGRRGRRGQASPATRFPSLPDPARAAWAPGLVAPSNG